MLPAVFFIDDFIIGIVEHIQILLFLFARLAVAKFDISDILRRVRRQVVKQFFHIAADRVILLPADAELRCRVVAVHRLHDLFPYFADFSLNFVHLVLI